MIDFPLNDLLAPLLVHSGWKHSFIPLAYGSDTQFKSGRTITE